MKAALLTELGRALGCPAENTGIEAVVKDSLPTDTRGARRVKDEGLPERCYYSGPMSELGPAPKRIPLLCGNSPMDREARDLARRGDEDLVRFFQMIAIARRRKLGRV